MALNAFSVLSFPSFSSSRLICLASPFFYDHDDDDAKPVYSNIFFVFISLNLNLNNEAVSCDVSMWKSGNKCIFIDSEMCGVEI